MAMFICKSIWNVRWWCCCCLLAFCPSSFSCECHSTAAWKLLPSHHGKGCCEHLALIVYIANQEYDIKTHYVRLFNPRIHLEWYIFWQIIFFDFSWTASARITRPRPQKKNCDIAHTFTWRKISNSDIRYTIHQTHVQKLLTWRWKKKRTTHARTHTGAPAERLPFGSGLIIY